MKLPPWNPEEAVFAWIQEELLELEHQDPTWSEEYFASLPVPTLAESLSSAERDAVAEARHGNFRMLGFLLDPRNPLSPAFRASLAPKTWALIAARLDGSFRGPVGRRKQTEEEKRAANPIHNAADMVLFIEEILRRHYPKQKKRDIRHRASCICQLDPKEVWENHIANYLGRSKKNPRRL